MKGNFLFFVIIFFAFSIGNSVVAYQITTEPIEYRFNSSYLTGHIFDVPDLQKITPSFVCSLKNNSNEKLFQVRAMYGYESGQTVRATALVAGVDLRAKANCQLIISTELKTLKPDVITSRWATLRGSLISYSNLPVKVAFKIWKQGEKEPNFSFANLQSKDFLTLNSPKEFTYNARYYNFNKHFEPKGKYCYRAVAVDAIQNKLIFESSNFECFVAKALNSKSFDELDVPFFSQSDWRWGWHLLNNGATFDADGCLNTALAMIVKYWYDHDPIIRKNWEAMYDECIANKCRNSDDSAFTATGKSPNPFSSHWVGTYYSGGKMDSWNHKEPWEKLGLVARSIAINNPGDLKKWYLERGVPVIFMCTPSFCSGHIRHYGVLLGFYSEKLFEAKQGKFLNYMFINDAAKYDSATGKARILDVNNHVFSTGIPRCGRQPKDMLMLDPQGSPPYSEGIAAIYPKGFKMDGFNEYPNK